jgi:hypothetical protein
MVMDSWMRKCEISGVGRISGLGLLPGRAGLGLGLMNGRGGMAAALRGPGLFCCDGRLIMGQSERSL